MPTTTPLTDAIQALTQYANETTGASDTTLSAAVGTLVAGYGQGGGTYEIEALLDNSLTSFKSDFSGSIRENLFYNNTNLVSVEFTSAWQIDGGCFYNCRSLSDAKFPNVTRTWGNNSFRQCYALKTLALPKWETCLATGTMFFNCTGLKVLDCGQLHNNGFGSSFFVNAPLEALIFRYNGVCPLNNAGAFNSTPFASGGAGGEIYVPSAQIENYKVANNWSTVHGRGTITWKAIEGSIYETQYADGTPIE